MAELVTVTVEKGPPPPEPATLSWTEVCVSVTDRAKNVRSILKDARGVVPPGHFCAVMGPSGCGKSTLLDTLSGRLAGSAVMTGLVQVNGHATQLTYGRAAFVTQDEVLLGVLTVRETILYAARLRLPTSANPAAVADAVVAELGLVDAANSIIGTWYQRGVSGGQRRRVAIGCELVLSPSIIFLDEPTSGLDAAAAFHVTSVLRRLAQGGRTVLAVIHQPASEVFELFDLLAVLAGGASVYFGPASDAFSMFTSALAHAPPAGRSAADHILHSINADFGDASSVADDVRALVAAYAKTPQAGDLDAKLREIAKAPGAPFHGHTGAPPAWRQAAVLTERALTTNWRDLGVFWMRLIMYVGLCICIGFLYFRSGHEWKNVFSITALLFFVVAFLTFMSISAFPAFVEEMKVFTRERLNGYYGVGSFVVSNTAASIPFIFGIAFFCTIGVYFIANLNITTGGLIVYFCLELFFSLLVVESLMMSIAPLVPHFLIGIGAGAGILGFFMLVCGFFQPTDQLPKPVFKYPFHYISFQTYAFAGFMNNQFADTTGWGCPCSAQPGGCPASMGGANCTLTGEEVLAYWGIHKWNKWYVSMLVLFGWAIFYRSVFYFTCKMKEAKMRA